MKRRAPTTLTMFSTTASLQPSNSSRAQSRRVKYATMAWRPTLASEWNHQRQRFISVYKKCTDLQRKLEAVIITWGTCRCPSTFSCQKPSVNLGSNSKTPKALSARRCLCKPVTSWKSIWYRARRSFKECAPTYPCHERASRESTTSAHATYNSLDLYPQNASSQPSWEWKKLKT